VVGQPGLRSYDSRRAAAHLSVSLVYLRDTLGYLQRIGVRFYRLASSLVPAPSADEGFRQLAACARELDDIAMLVQQHGLRLTLHPGQAIALGSADNALAARGMAALELQAALLERLGMGPEGVIVVHVGGAARDRAALQRFAARYHALSAAARARLVVEHDTTGCSLGAALELHQLCGVPVVFDYLHWQLCNPERLPLGLGLGLALATWPPGVRPKIHLSTARSEAHLLPASRSSTARVLPPRPGQHADFIAATDAIRLLRAARGLPPFDIMLEAKAGDLALLRLRTEVARLEPELAALLG
jgi:UV DNA damage endonuclease